jgi:predicted PhzF superfamily epimerase YddE/YHI9
MAVPFYQVDAFTDEAFRGNPAAVCLLPAWPDDRWLRAVAAENNLSETAFVVQEPDGLRLRWFTPTTEVTLCGHATLAAAWVLLVHLGGGDQVQFHTLSGVLTVRRAGELLTMDFPALPPREGSVPEGLAATLGAAPLHLLPVRSAPHADYYLAVYGSQAEVAALRPDTVSMGGRFRANVVATAPGERVDLVSRFFAPASGIPEDPVTGSAHCTLAPYWAARLGKTVLEAEQISERGGRLRCELVGDRVALTGRCVVVIVGELLG